MQAININLLPWREAKRKEDQREFALSWLVAAAIAAGIVFAIFSVYQGLISGQKERNTYISSEISILDKDIKKINELKAQKTRLEARMDLIQSLQGDRPIVVKVFDALIKLTPEGVTFSNWSHKDDSFKIKAYAANNNQISQLMRDLDRSPLFENAYLSNVTAERKGKNKFDLTVKLESLEKVSMSQKGVRK